MQLEEYNQHFSSQLQTQLLYLCKCWLVAYRLARLLIAYVVQSRLWILIRSPHFLVAAAAPDVVWYNSTHAHTKLLNLLVLTKNPKLYLKHTYTSTCIFVAGRLLDSCSLKPHPRCSQLYQAVCSMVSTLEGQVPLFPCSFIPRKAISHIFQNYIPYSGKIWRGLYFGGLANRQNIAKFKFALIGASVSEPHTTVFNCDFSWYYILSYVVPYILDSVI